MALDSGSALSTGLVLVQSYDDKAANLRQSLLHNTKLPEEQLLRALFAISNCNGAKKT
jgi:hypothetical protein